MNDLSRLRPLRSVSYGYEHVVIRVGGGGGFARGSHAIRFPKYNIPSMLKCHRGRRSRQKNFCNYGPTQWDVVQ